MGAVGIVKDELLYTNRDWPLNSWALPPITVPGMWEAFANCFMNKSLNKSFQCLWRVVQLKHQRSSEEEEIPARWETHRILHREGWLMESWKEEKMEIELSRWWFQQNQCHTGRKMGVRCTELIIIVHPLLSYLFTWADWCLCLQFPQSWSILPTSAGLIFLKHSYIMTAQLYNEPTISSEKFKPPSQYLSLCDLATVFLNELTTALSHSVSARQISLPSIMNNPLLLPSFSLCSSL